MNFHDEYRKLGDLIWHKARNELDDNFRDLTRDMPIRGESDIFRTGKNELHIYYVGDGDFDRMIMRIKEKATEKTIREHAFVFLHNKGWLLDYEYKDLLDQKDSDSYWTTDEIAFDFLVKLDGNCC